MKFDQNGFEENKLNQITRLKISRKNVTKPELSRNALRPSARIITEKIFLAFDFFLLISLSRVILAILSHTFRELKLELEYGLSQSSYLKSLQINASFFK